LRDYAARIAVLWRFKATLFAILTIVFCVPYFLLGNFRLFRVHDLPMARLDRAIGYHPASWVWVYQSIYILINVIPWLAVRREDLSRYVRGFAIVSIVSFAIFFIYPVASPRGITPAASSMHQLLLAYDAPLNALPSLHAGLLVYTLAYGRRILRGNLPAWIAVATVIWGGLILYATLATKEHYAMDIISGSALGLIADAIVWQSSMFKRRPVMDEPADWRRLREEGVSAGAACPMPDEDSDRLPTPDRCCR
jgi:hypothetical protein